VGFGWFLVGFPWVITFEFSLLFQLDGGVRRLKHGFVAVNRRGLGLVPRLAREGRVLSEIFIQRSEDPARKVV
jgi:hypothetical protein